MGRDSWRQKILDETLISPKSCSQFEPCRSDTSSSKWCRRYEIHFAHHNKSLACVSLYQEEAQFSDHKLLERLVEPERQFMFRVPWVDDSGKVQVNRGFLRWRFMEGCCRTANLLFPQLVL